MAKRRTSRKIGLSPGTLVYVGEQKTETVKLTVFDYAAGHCEEKEIQSLAQCRPLMERSSVTCSNVTGIHDLAIVEALGGSSTCTRCCSRTWSTRSSGRSRKTTTTTCSSF